MLSTFTGVVWGSQFVVGKSALARVDSFWLTNARYAVAGVLLLGLLAVVEGGRALLPAGRLWQLAALGTLGFAGFNLLAYTGLEHARPESASLIVALAPLLTALVLWARKRVRPSRATFVCLLVALVGVSLVISGGHPSTLWHGSLGAGDLLVYRRRAQLRALHDRRRRPPRHFGAPLHGLDRGAGMAGDRGSDPGRDRRRVALGAERQRLGEPSRPSSPIWRCRAP